MPEEKGDERTSLLRAVAVAGFGNYNWMNGGSVYDSDLHVRLELRLDLDEIDAAIVDARAVEIMLDRFRADARADVFTYGCDEGVWVFRAGTIRTPNPFPVSHAVAYAPTIVEVSGPTRAWAVARAYAQYFGREAA